MQGWAQALRTSEALGILLGGVVTSESQINQADFQNKTRTLLTALQQNLREIEEQHTNSERGDGQVCPSPISPFFFPSHFFLAETLLPSVPFFFCCSLSLFSSLFSRCLLTAETFFEFQSQRQDCGKGTAGCFLLFFGQFGS